MLSVELNKICCLLHETWYIGIQEAWRFALNQNFDKMREILIELHEKTKISENSKLNLKFKDDYKM